jgi:DNA-binding response OmpR family regulator
MLTFPTTNAIRSGLPVTGPGDDQQVRPGATGSPVGLVVHLELPARASAGTDPGLSAGPDLHQLARAVEELVRVAAPSVITRVSVESALGAPHRPEVSPRLRPVPAGAAPAATSLPRDDDGIDIDVVGRSLRVDAEPVELTRREFDLLAYLYGRRSVALSRRELMNAVWQTGYLAGDRTIDVHVRRVRAKLGRHAHRLTTLRGFGYRFD